MCGIAGYFSERAPEFGGGVLVAMGDAIAHRGPDDQGAWFDAESGIGFVHRRLAIVDLSEAGHQPMASHSYRYIIVFNGEIYNHLDLRKALETQGQAPDWRGHSDTETLLAGFDAWGIEATLERAVGMFAFAVWDRHERVLHLARDRMGEKPLYYGWSKGCFLFGSELKAMRAHPAFDAYIDRDAVAELLRFQYISSPRSIFTGFYKLPPGSIVSVSLDNPNATPRSYWSVAEAARHGMMHGFAGSFDDAVEMLETLLEDTISQQMIADVPVGAFLSGGIDSSLIVALMSQVASQPVKTFSIGFSETEFDEAPFARQVADALNTDHTEFYVTPNDALAVIPRLPQLYDEPLADVSSIPTLLVSGLARSRVTVSLSGDAGDELFGGYSTYRSAERFLSLHDHLPQSMKQTMARSAATASHFASRIKRGALARRMALLNNVLNASDHDQLTDRLLGHWSGEQVPVVGSTIGDTRNSQQFDALRLDPLTRMMARDMTFYLPDDVLAKVDRAAMAVSLETRVPFLDHRIVEFAMSLPLDFKLRDGTGKAVLRELLYRHVPRALVDRPKKGFGVPLAAWLRGPLRDWAFDLLEPTRLNSDGLFDATAVLAAFDEHLSVRRDRHNDLWPVLMVQQWMRQ
jgi:asparagine synthase (glutamine-hydrolysing)